MVSLVAFHTGATVEAQERVLADKPTLFGVPAADELDVVNLLALSTSLHSLEITPADRGTEIWSRYGPDDPCTAQPPGPAPG